MNKANSKINWMEFNDMFNHFYDNLLPYKRGGVTPKQAYQWHPETNIYETADGYHVEVELPGVDRKEIEMTFENGELCIKGKRERYELSDQVTEHWSERPSGKFERSFQFGDKVNSESIKAVLENGVLSISLKKKNELMPKLIKIQ